MDLPKPPEETDLRNIIDKLAQFVARNGPEFEHMTKQKQKDNPKFSFLFGGEHFNYYQYRVTTEQAILKQKQRSVEQQVVQHSITQQSLQSAPWQQHCAIPLQPSQEIQEQIRQSEQNLAAQHQLLLQQQQVQIDDIIRKAQEEKLMKMAQAADISLEELDKVSQPIIEQCTKDSISGGKGWIFSNSSTAAKIEVICEYLLKRVISPTATFDARLHLVYLINDVLHHCVRKNADDLKTGLSRVVVPIFCTTSLGVDEEKQQKLEKLLKLWETHNYFDASVLEQLKNPAVTVAAFQAGIITEHANYISTITTAIQTQYAMLQKQHQDYIAHLTGQLQQMQQTPFGYPQQMHPSLMGTPMSQQPLNQPNQTGMSATGFGNILQANQQAQQQQQTKMGGMNMQGSENNPQVNQPNIFMQQNMFAAGGEQQNSNLNPMQLGLNMKMENRPQMGMSQQNMGGGMSIALHGPFNNQGGQMNQVQQNNFQGTGVGMPSNFQPNNQFNPMGPNFMGGTGGLNQAGNFNQGPPPFSQMQQQFPSGPVHIPSRFGDFYKLQPPPAFNLGNSDIQSNQLNQGALPNMGVGGIGPGGPFQQPLPDVMRETVMPSVPYYDLPAGLMVPLVALEEQEYRPLDPDDIRLPPPAPPSERLITAVEMFYAPPSHDRPRNSDGWEQLGLYEFFKAKSNCKKQKTKSSDDHLNSEGDDSRDTQESNTQDEPFPNNGSSPLLPTPSMAPNPMWNNQPGFYDQEQSPPRRRYRETKSPPPSASISGGQSGSNFKITSPRRRARSRSRSKTPPTYTRPNRSRSRSRSRTPSRSRSRSYSRSRSRSRSRSPPPRSRNTRKYSRSRSKSRSRSRSRSRTPPRRRDDRSPSPPRFSGLTAEQREQRLDESNKGHQLLKKMGWSGMGLGAAEQGIQDPIHAGDVRDRQDQYKGVGVSLNDPYESFRKSKGQAFINRMKARAEEMGKT